MKYKLVWNPSEIYDESYLVYITGGVSLWSNEIQGIDIPEPLLFDSKEEVEKIICPAWKKHVSIIEVDES
jgi:hypothetical protein